MNWQKVDTNSGFVPLSPRGSCLEELLINSTSTYITSPNYPRNYDHNLNCDWILRSDRMSRIQIRLVDLVLEANSRCRFDALTVYDGMYGSENWNATNRYCVSFTWCDF